MRKYELLHCSIISSIPRCLPRDHDHTSSYSKVLASTCLQNDSRIGRNTNLVLTSRTHSLDNLLALRLRHTPLLRDNLRQHNIDLPCHVRCITADVEVCLLLQELVNFLGVFLEAVLDVDFAWSFAGESGDELKFVAEGVLIFL
jgi:hypothetical protein